MSALELVPESQTGTVRTLGSIGTWVGGGTPSKANEAFWTDGTIPWVSAKDMKFARISGARDFITEEAVRRSSTRLVPAGSVLVVVRSGILSHTLPVAIAERDVAINQDLKALIPSDDVDSEYVRLFLVAYADDILSHCSKAGTTVASIDMDRFSQFKIPIPAIQEQRRVVKEGLAASLALDTVANECSRIEVLGQHIVSQFLADVLRCDEDELPNGWQLRAWEEVGKTISGRAFPSTDYCQDGVRLIRPGNLDDNGKVRWTKDNTVYLPTRYAKSHSELLFRGAHIVVNLTAQSLKDAFLGRACITGENDEFLLNQRLAIFEPYEADKRFCLYVLKSKAFRRFVDAGLNSGSLIQHIHVKQLRNFVFPIPPLDEQRRIAQQIEAIMERSAAVNSDVFSARRLSSRLQKAQLKKRFSSLSAME